MRRFPLLWTSILVATMLASAAPGSTISQSIDAYFQRANGVSNAPILLAIGSADATDFPATSTSAGFSYRFNVTLGTFERVPGPAAPVYSERASTIGADRVGLAYGYSYIEFITLSGTKLSKDATQLPQLRTDRFVIDHHVSTFAATYGVSDRFDLNLLVPVFYSVFDARGHLEKGRLDIGHEDAFGVGDILIRSKYHVGVLSGIETALGIELRLPSGSVDDFQGRGDTSVYPAVILSRMWGHWEGRLRLGTEIDADTLAASRARYEAGVGIHSWGPLTMWGDLTGKSLFVRRTEDIRIPRLGLFQQEVSRTDILDVVTGVTVEAGSHGSLSVGARVPLNPDEGLRPEVVPFAACALVF